MPRAHRPIVLLAACGLAISLVGPAPRAMAQGGPLSEPFQSRYCDCEIQSPIGFVARGVEQRDRAGRSVASAGDLNGDGVDDLIIGAHGNRATDEPGDAYVVFGLAQGAFPSDLELADLDGNNGFKLVGFRERGQTGYAVASAGDVNNDGIDDVIIGAPTATSGSGYGAGECYVVFGRDAAADPFPARLELRDLDGSDGFRMEGAAGGLVGAGASVAAAGDANGDGIDDIVLGAVPVYGSPGSAGTAAFVVFGRDASAGATFPAVLPLSSLDGDIGFRMPEVDFVEDCGGSVAGLGDVNGDGLDDIVVGARRALGGSGRAYVVFGRDATAGPGFPAEVSLADLDGSDGFRLLGRFRERAGEAVGSAGDINADGTPDIAIGAPSNFGNGSSYVVFGRADGAFNADIQLSSIGGDAGFRLTADDDGNQAQSGYAIGTVGDINGDGFHDLAVGAPGFGYRDSGYLTYENYGAAFVVFGRDADAGEPFPDELVLTDLDGDDGFMVYGNEPDSSVGSSVSTAGDLNGDGNNDFAIGASRLDRFTGAALVLYGRDLFPCPADLDGDGELTIFDFLAFQNLFDLMDPLADFDGDGEFTIFDFLAFQNAFDAGCP